MQPAPILPKPRIVPALKDGAQLLRPHWILAQGLRWAQPNWQHLPALPPSLPAWTHLAWVARTSPHAWGMKPQPCGAADGKHPRGAFVCPGQWSPARLGYGECPPGAWAGSIQPMPAAELITGR